MGGIKKEAEGWCNSWGSPILRKKGKETERINTNESAVGVSGKKNFQRTRAKHLPRVGEKGRYYFQGIKGARLISTINDQRGEECREDVIIT